MKSSYSKKVILMDPFPALGHINAFLNLARWLSDKEYEIVFIGSTEHHQIYKSEGFRFYDLNPLILIPETYEIKTKGRFKFFLDNVYESRYKSSREYFHSASKAYESIINVVRPDLILLDDHYALKTFFYNRFSVNIIMVSTMTISLKSKGKPPFQSTYVPQGNQASSLYIDFLWAFNRMNRFVRSLVSSFLCIGKTDLKILKKLCGNSRFTIDRSRCFGIGIKDIPMIATYPKPFDFVDIESSRSVLYYGQLPKVASEEINDPRLSGILNHFSAENRIVIYCSLGTITSNDLKVCHAFFKRMVAVAVKNPQWYFLLNVGRHYDINKLPSTPENISVFTHVPQKQLLNRVDIMINHGGINSIKECLSANTPMIIYPLSLKWDQPGCGARVAYHKIGTIGNIRKDNAKTIYTKISFLIEHLDEYKDNIRSLNNKIDKVNRSENQKILSLIENYVTQQYIST